MHYTDYSIEELHNPFILYKDYDFGNNISEKGSFCLNIQDFNLSSSFGMNIEKCDIDIFFVDANFLRPEKVYFEFSSFKIKGTVRL